MPPDGVRWPVSVKGVLLDGDRVVLLRNERDEWELPGGRLEAGETIEECLVREVHEELGVVVEVGPPLDAWLYDLPEGTVLILTYGCTSPSYDGMHHSAEHRELAWLPVDSLPAAPLPAGYVPAIERWRAQTPTA
ncbi:MAG TPA: NUDIX domain-containing protein [Acidimicrobiia bacterium]